MRRVIIESPFRASAKYTQKQNIEYALRAMRDCFIRGEAPFASHIFYTQALDDGLIHERNLGMQAGFVWGRAADLTAVYQDHGISSGMERGITEARTAGREIEYRNLEDI